MCLIIAASIPQYLVRHLIGCSAATLTRYFVYSQIVETEMKIQHSGVDLEKIALSSVV